jgi:hypothetical protein
VWRRHEGVLDEVERAAYEATRHAERAWMDHLAGHVKSGLVVLPLFLVWAMTLVILLEMDANPAWLVMATPGYLLFGALLYAMAYGFVTGGRERYYGRDRLER